MNRPWLLSGALAFAALLPLLGPAPAALGGGGGEPLLWRDVTFAGGDGFEIAGTLALPNLDAVAPAVVLVHMLGRDRTTMRSLQKEIANIEGGALGSLAIDLRGHGASLKQKGVEKRFKQFGKEDWLGIPRDIAASVRFLRSQPSIDKERIGIVGASIGANAAAIAAAEDDKVRAIVLLSPGADYHGLMPLPALERWGARPLLALSGGAEDDYSRETLAEIEKRLKGRTRIKVFEGAGHGTEILEARPDALKLVSEFLKSNL